VALRVAEEVDEFAELFGGFVDTGDVGERDSLGCAVVVPSRSSS